MKKMKVMVWLALITTVSGCASVQVLSPVERHVGQSVDLNKITIASVGDTIFSQFNYQSRDGAITKDTLSQKVLLGKVLVPVGEVLLQYSIDGKKAFCTRTKTYIDPLTGPLAPTCFVDIDSNGVFDKLLVRPGMVFIERDLKQPLRYARKAIQSGSTGYKYELLYNGISGNVLNISYREFMDNMIRPAFRQDLQYTLNDEGTTHISFKGVQIEVISADNNGIKYKVTSAFSE